MYTRDGTTYYEYDFSTGLDVSSNDNIEFALCDAAYQIKYAKNGGSSWNDYSPTEEITIDPGTQFDIEIEDIQVLDDSCTYFWRKLTTTAMII